MSDARPLVRSTIDPKQIKQADRREKRSLELEADDLRAVLATEEGRRVIWRVLGYCHFAKDIWDPSSRIHFLAGQQNVGHWLLAKVNAANDEAFFTMMRESKERQQRQDAETAAIQPGENDGDD